MIRSIRWASLGLGHVETADAPEISSWRYGEIEIIDGRLSAVYGRWLPRITTQWHVWQDSYNKTLSPDTCRFYYALPIGSPGYLSILYTHSGPKTRYCTFRAGILAIDRIAIAWRCKAIVCQASNERLSERMMNRWGYVRHAFSLGNNHYIKRLNDPTG
jgi:hypothetical protein